MVLKHLILLDIFWGRKNATIALKLDILSFNDTDCHRAAQYSILN